nr:hypothetical protein [Tanacetum cinerariifolium]
MIDAQVGDLYSHTTKYTSPALTQKVFANMRRVGKGFSGVDTLLFDGMLVPQQVNDDDVADVVADADAEPTSPTPATTPLHHHKNLSLPHHRRMHPNMGKIAKLDADEDVTLEDVVAEVAKDDKVKRKEKEDNAVLRYQALKRKPETEAQAKKNMMVYFKNIAGFKKDFFKGMSYDDIRPIFEKHFNSIMAFQEKGEKELEKEASKPIKRKSETSKEKAAKKEKLDEEVKELKTHL